MASNKVWTCDIEGVYIYNLSKNTDERGWLMEMFRTDELNSENHPVMGYVSETQPGVLRGPHEHSQQSDYFVFMLGDFRLYLREKYSRSHQGCDIYYYPRFEVLHNLGASGPVGVIVPPGVVHAYRNVSNKPGLVFNFPNKLYKGAGKHYPVDEIRHETNEQYMLEITEYDAKLEGNYCGDNEQVVS